RLARHRLCPLFFLLSLRPSRSTLFPYTTLFRSNEPETFVLCQVPLPLVAELRHLYVEGVRVPLALPIPAVAGHDAGAVAFLVALGDQIVQLRGRIDHAEVELGGIQHRIGGLPDAQDVVQPREVAVRAAAAELRRELEVGDRGAEILGNLLDGAGGADVRERNDLVVVYEENGAVGAADQLRDLVFAQV